MSTQKEMPLVTVAIPTYMRPELLRRALKSVAFQSYPNLEVIVADNCSDNYRLEDIIIEFKQIFKNFKFIRHPQNMGSINNFFYCLGIAHGTYFMWLADDDEISGQDYISTLVSILISREDVATASAKWKLMMNSFTGYINPPREYASNYWFMRAFKFIWFARDDFFYALHRTDVLRSARIVNFSGVIKNRVDNLVYPFLLDIVMQGKVVYSNSKNISWVNHDYTVKSYQLFCSKCEYVFNFLLRRANVHCIYLMKILKKNYLYLFIFIPFCFLALLKDYFVFFGGMVFRNMKKLMLHFFHIL